MQTWIPNTAYILTKSTLELPKVYDPRYPNCHQPSGVGWADGVTPEGVKNENCFVCWLQRQLIIDFGRTAPNESCVSSEVKYHARVEPNWNRRNQNRLNQTQDELELW